MKFNLDIQIRADTHDQIQHDLSAIKKALRRRKDSLDNGNDELIEVNGYNYEVKIANMRTIVVRSINEGELNN